MVQDPIVHFNQSPYSSFDGNPVYWADPSGAATSIKEMWDATSEDGSSHWVNTGDGNFEEAEEDEKEKSGDSDIENSFSNFNLNHRYYSNSSRKIEKNPICPKCWWLNNDEFLTWEEAIWHYRLGKGQPLEVRLSRLNLSKISVRDFENAKYKHQGYPMIYVNFDLDYYTNPNQALVYGNIALVYIGDNTVMALPDTYDFDLKFKSDLKGFIRDFATMAGSLYNGAGTPYIIYFLGTAKIKD